MKRLAKRIFPYIPVWLRRIATSVYEVHYARIASTAMGLEGVDVSVSKTGRNVKPRMLFYHPSGLSFGGTEKFLQILARHINKDKYDTYFLYSAKPRRATGLDLRLDGRLSYLEGQGVKLIAFDYESMDQDYPYVIRKATPTIFEVLRQENIDLVVTAGTGYTEFPFNLIRDIPIVMLNIFGSFNVQKNFALNCCISNEVADKIRPIVPEKKIEVMYIPSDGPTAESLVAGQALRGRLGIAPEAMVFGRIGRGSDDIFDPIGIRAFQRLVAEDQSVHYLIMSPMPVVKKIVEEEKIPNVHFLPASSSESDVWAFHQVIDCLAHFRHDGESCGLNIAEAMLCAKPIITHRSPIWNAHLEYLKPEFSRVADINDIDGYYAHMKEYTALKKEGGLARVGELARAQAEPLFLIKNSITRFEGWVDKILCR